MRGEQSADTYRIAFRDKTRMRGGDGSQRAVNPAECATMPEGSSRCCCWRRVKRTRAARDLASRVTCAAGHASGQRLPPLAGWQPSASRDAAPPVGEAACLRSIASHAGRTALGQAEWLDCLHYCAAAIVPSDSSSTGSDPFTGAHAAPNTRMSSKQDVTLKFPRTAVRMRGNATEPNTNRNAQPDSEALGPLMPGWRVTESHHANS